MKKIAIEQIDFGLAYQGYLWLSNEQNPRLFDNERVDEDLFKALPFIMEGFLFSEAHNELSIKIRYVEGEYLIFSVFLKDIPQDKLSSLDYATIKNAKGFKQLESVQYWEEIPDELCEGMSVLEPSWVAFKGFKK